MQHADMDNACASGKRSLTFPEFQDMFESTELSPQALQGWFCKADLDEDGFLSLDEMFQWTLHTVRASESSRLRTLLQRHSNGGPCGCLDEMQFVRALSGLGLKEDAARMIFGELCDKSSPTVLVDNLFDITATESRTSHFKRVVTRLMLENEFDSAAKVSTAGWSFSGGTPSAARSGLCELLTIHHVQFRELFAQVFDDDGSGLISQVEFRQGMIDDMGYSGSMNVLFEIWDILDADGVRCLLPHHCESKRLTACALARSAGSGQISFEEFNEWISSKASDNAEKLDLMRRLTLRDRIIDEETEWNSMRLRTELQAIFADRGLCAVDVFREWDADRDDVILRTEVREPIENYE